MRIDERTIELPPRAGARAVALGLLAEATAAAEALAAGAGDEPLHDFRVALRRFRSALRAFQPWLGVRRRRVRKLRQIARSTNEARDAEVQLAWLTAHRHAFASAPLRPGYERLAARLEAGVRRGPDATRAAERFRRAARKLERKLASQAKGGAADRGATLGLALASLLREGAGALSGRMRAIGGAADEDGVHRARIEGKRLRYLLEPLRGFRGADASAPVARLKRLQDLLGELHDAHVLAAELRDVLAEAAAEHARRLHAAIFAPAAGARAIRDAARGRPRAGLLAILRLVRERRDALHAELERTWRAGGMDALAAEIGAVAASLEARAEDAPARAHAPHGLRRAGARRAVRRPRRRGPAHSPR